MGEPLLRVRNLRTQFFTRAGVVQALRGVDLDVEKGEAVGLAGETGSGKSVTAYSIMRLVAPPGRIVGGEIVFKGRDLLSLSEKEMRRVRGSEISMIFQDPSAYLDPVMRVGDQIGEVFRTHERVSRKEAEARTKQILELVRLPPERLRAYPHELSGGMQQRVVIAEALSGHLDLVLADEPTTSLDVTVQAQILDLIRELQEKTGMALLLISHNLAVIAETCHRVGIMYAGAIVEFGPVESVLRDPKHPYTKALLNSVPRLGPRKQRLETIGGSVPSLIDPPTGCAYHPRCPYAMDVCRTVVPRDVDIEPERRVGCHLYG